MERTPKILIVDDDESVLRWMKSTLTSNGYDASATTSAREALTMIEESRPDLLILDLNMPAPDGFEVLRSQRARFPGLHILVVSGHMHTALLEAASILGATATLSKPIDLNELLRTVRDIVGK